MGRTRSEEILGVAGSIDEASSSSDDFNEIKRILQEGGAQFDKWLKEISDLTGKTAQALDKAGFLDVDAKDVAFVSKYPMFGLVGNLWNGKVVHNSITQLKGANPSPKDVKAFVAHAMSLPKADELDVYPCRMWWD
jgi:hypothetical protein